MVPHHFLIAIIGLSLHLTTFGDSMQRFNENCDRWVWAGHSIGHHQNKILYIFQGHFDQKGGRPRFERLGYYPHRLEAKGVYLVYRLDQLISADFVVQRIMSDSSKWKSHGIDPIGVQIDFDAASSKLDQYGEYLALLKVQLPPDIKLSITALVDWLLSGNKVSLTRLTQISDEIVFQLYQGTKPIRNLEGSIPAFQSLEAPFKIGIVDADQNASSSYAALLKNRNSAGCIIFPTTTKVEL